MKSDVVGLRQLTKAPTLKVAITPFFRTTTGILLTANTAIAVHTSTVETLAVVEQPTCSASGRITTLQGVPRRRTCQPQSESLRRCSLTISSRMTVLLFSCHCTFSKKASGTPNVPAALCRMLMRSLCPFPVTRGCFPLFQSFETVWRRTCPIWLAGGCAGEGES